MAAERDKALDIGCAKDCVAEKQKKQSKGTAKKRSLARIQIRGMQKKEWHEWVNQARQKNKLPPHSDRKTYDYSFKRAIKFHKITEESFVELVRTHKARFGPYGFLKMLKNCGLIEERKIYVAKTKVVGRLIETVGGNIHRKKAPAEKNSNVAMSLSENLVQKKRVTQIAQSVFKKYQQSKGQLTQQLLQTWITEAWAPSSPSSKANLPHIILMIKFILTFLTVKFALIE